MKRIRTITTAMMLSASLLGITTYALTPSDEAGQSETTESAAEGKGIPDISTTEEVGDIKSDEERSADDGLKEYDDKKKNQKKDDGKKNRENKGADASSSNWLSIVALVVGAGGVALGWTNRKSLENLDKNNKDLKASTSKAIADLNGRIEALTQNLSNTRQTIEKQDRELLNLRRAQASMNANMQPSFDQPLAVTPDTPVQHYQGGAQDAPQAAPQAPQQTIRLYCGAPNGGIFTNPSRTPSNKALYIITYTGGGTSYYSYVDTRDGAMLAARSISDFLEPGCIISGTKNPNFTKVKTVTPGTVRRLSNGSWVIESKAEVELV